MRVPQDTDISRRKETRKGVQYEGFIDRVRPLAELDSFSEAEGATKATLTMLGDYLASGEARSASLPLSFRRSWPSTFTGSRLTARRAPLFGRVPGRSRRARGGEHRRRRSPRPRRHDGPRRGRLGQGDGGCAPAASGRVRSSFRLEVKSWGSWSPSFLRIGRRTSGRTLRRSFLPKPPSGAAGRGRALPSDRRASPRR